MSPIPQQPSTAVNPHQPVGSQPVTPHNSVLTSRPAHRITSAITTSGAHFFLPDQKAPLKLNY